MRAILVVLCLIGPLAGCEEAAPTFGSGGWQDDDVPEAIPVGDDAASVQAPNVSADDRPAVRATAAQPETAVDQTADSTQNTVAPVPAEVVVAPPTPAPAAAPGASPPESPAEEPATPAAPAT